jgi:predicted RNA-binding protein with RPS1 domain
MIAKPGVRVGMGEERTAAIGKVTLDLLKKDGIAADAFKKNVVYTSATVNELGDAVKLGHIDAAIVWSAEARYYPNDADMVAIPVKQNIVVPVPAAVLTCTGDKEAAQQFVDERFGMPTFLDIASELRSPAYDTRPPFRLATFKEGIDDLADLKPGMILEGVVTNVASFGAFVDVGVHQDGLVHVSRLADRFVKDPHEVVRAGDIVKVKVLEVDLERKRVALTMRFEKKPAPAARASAPRQPREAGNRQAGRKKPAAAAPPARGPPGAGPSAPCEPPGEA